LEICQIDKISSIENVELQQLLTDKGIVSILSIPLKTRSNQIGTLTCYRYTIAQPWSDLEVKLLQAVCDQLAIALNQAELYQQSCESAKYANLKNEELKQTLLKLQRTQSQLIQAEKMSSLGQLVAGIAHEINNPVNFIFGNLTYAHDYISDILGLIKLYQETYPEPTAEIADQIENIELDFLVEDVMKLLNSMKIGAERIREIVKSLRTFSRLDEAEVKAVDIHENLDSTLMILQNRLKAKNNYSPINVIKNYGKLPLIECYSGQLNQVFMNIIANAIDVLEDRQKRLTEIEVKANPSQIIISTIINQTNQVEIRIADNGLGMNQDIVDKIFDPFYTTKAIGKGTGLGLSISYQIIVEKHHGQLRCISELGKGTQFIIEIPLKQFG
jgi:signal transduction histidine kinase